MNPLATEPLAIAVVGHHQRAARATALSRSLGAELFLDNGELGSMVNHLRAWSWAAEQDTTHALVIEDDALPIDNFLVHAHRVPVERPIDMVCLYVGRQRPHGLMIEGAVRRAQHRQASWLTHPHLLWGQAVIMPTEWIKPVLAAMDQSGTYDLGLGKGWRRRTGRLVRYTWPSLVDHDDALPQVTDRHARRPPGRVAWQVGVPSWTGGTVHILGG